MNRIVINPEYCKGCNICVSCCPKGVLQPSKTLNEKGYTLPEPVESENCICCKMCETVCPDFAVAVEKKEKIEQNK